MNHIQTNRILKPLRIEESMRYLPKTCRTLLQTPRESPTVICVPPGDYLHVGLKAALLRLLLSSKVEPPAELHFDLFVGGAQLNKKNCIWGLLCRIPDVSDHLLKVIGVYKGPKKPGDCSEFLKKFRDEFLYIKERGCITLNDKTIVIKLRCLIADAPARAFLLNHMGHTSKDPCSKWKVHGFSYFTKKGRKTVRYMVFREIGHTLRTT